MMIIYKHNFHIIFLLITRLTIYLSLLEQSQVEKSDI